LDFGRRRRECKVRGGRKLKRRKIERRKERREREGENGKRGGGYYRSLPKPRAWLAVS